MLKPDPHPNDDPDQKGAPDGSPSFKELLLLVFSGPMCFECLDDNEEAESAAKEEHDKRT